ncbi:MAG: glutathione S-transferase C-terminal domain-containing protein [Alphaproteobacteria bacterium]|jgi:hypothetical protein|nr:hypothetical protein [Rhodospirillaceae bacterium]MBT6509817.1 hypothetical protein [Rhodospirillaceae bacterium]MBT7612878.1 hypothetical protein [Rhodospirillaceae bacterium]MBT7647170.1 hypothetical protein [Rhodospirillaceae bacterium]MDG2481202.1 glutathione S-transferase C-terminal domain-containing protein [Alphaproteobacteria bacterium]
MSWSNQYLDPPLTDLVLHKVRLPLEERSDEAVERWNQAMIRFLRILDRHLSDKNFIAGSEPTIAEFSIGPNVHRWVLFALPHGACRISMPGIKGSANGRHFKGSCCRPSSILKAEQQGYVVWRQVRRALLQPRSGIGV